MKNILRHVHDHHKKYLFWIFWGFAVVKLFLLVLWLSVVQYSYTSIFAEWETGCTLTGQYYTWDYQTWGYLTGQELTWGYLTGCTTIPGYRTWGILDESWNLTWQERVEESQTGCELTWQTLTEWYLTWYYLTWGYRTWGYLTWCIQQQNVPSWNGICESGDIVRNTPVSWSLVRDIFPITWAYSGTDCRLSGLSLQLRDHNSQRITLGTVASWTTIYTFDSKKLYSFQQSGFYHIIGNTGAGNFYLYTGTYTWTYSRFFTWYKVRLLTPSQTPLYETPSFTIDNQVPTLTWISLLSSWSATWYLNVSGIVTLTFTASEELNPLQVTLWTGRSATSSIVSWLTYTYIRNLSSLYTEGPLAATISFADRAGNTGIVLYTSSLIFDKTRPIITGFVFSEYTEGLHMNFTSSEPVRYMLNYRKTWWSFITGASADYLTAQQLSFSWIERDQLYTFTLDAFDRAGNNRSMTGEFMRTNLWQIVSNISLVPVADESVISWSLSTLAVILKAEVE